MSFVIPERSPAPTPGSAPSPGPAVPPTPRNPSPAVSSPSALPLRSARWRGLIEGLACLTIAVLLARTFLVEGYMISTGSMAPALLGYHKRVVCPTCEFPFAHGVAFDGSHDSQDMDSRLVGDGESAICPNCGESRIDISKVPRNHGDQLLVFKPLFDFRPPRRFEVAVFHNPNHPAQAYVKRIVGLPGESIQIQEGDLFANGEICRKTLAFQRAMRIPVLTAAHTPHHIRPETPHWDTGSGWRASRATGTFEFAPPPQSPTPTTSAKTNPASAPSAHTSEPAWNWLTFVDRHPASDKAIATAAVSHLPLGFSLPSEGIDTPVAFLPDIEDAAKGTLIVEGPLSIAWEDRLRDLSASREFQTAIDRLAHVSRNPGVTDTYGYNDRRELGRNHVDDLMIATRLRLADSAQLTLEMGDWHQRFQFRLDAAGRTVSLWRLDSDEPLHSVPMPAALLTGESVLVEMSVMDRQVLVAINGVEPFPPWRYEPNPTSTHPPALPRIAARDGTVNIDELNLYRDVYYTPGYRRNGIHAPYRLGSKEYFVLGDNSPVSLDSRSWNDPAVPANLLVGKPFVVHLPSRPAKFQIGPYQLTIRVPDFQKMRYIE